MRSVTAVPPFSSTGMVALTISMVLSLSASAIGASPLLCSLYNLGQFGELQRRQPGSYRLAIEAPLERMRLDLGYVEPWLAVHAPEVQLARIGHPVGQGRRAGHRSTSPHSLRHHGRRACWSGRSGARLAAALWTDGGGDQGAVRPPQSQNVSDP